MRWCPESPTSPGLHKARALECRLPAQPGRGGAAGPVASLCPIGEPRGAAVSRTGTSLGRPRPRSCSSPELALPPVPRGGGRSEAAAAGAGNPRGRGAASGWSGRPEARAVPLPRRRARPAPAAGPEAARRPLSAHFFISHLSALL